MSACFLLAKPSHRVENSYPINVKKTFCPALQDVLGMFDAGAGGSKWRIVPGGLSGVDFTEAGFNSLARIECTGMVIA